MKQQMNLDIKLHKIFDSCKLDGRWKHEENPGNPHDYTALEDGSSIILYLENARLTETFSFKKDSNISIKDSLIEYHSKDLMR